MTPPQSGGPGALIGAPAVLDALRLLLRRYPTQPQSDERDRRVWPAPRLGAGGIEIGYWIHVDAIGNGYATEAAGALTRVALQLTDIDRVEIHCDEANVRSAAVPRKLGYVLDRIENDDIEAPGETGRSMIWVMQTAQAAQTSDRPVAHRCRSR